RVGPAAARVGQTPPLDPDRQRPRELTDILDVAVVEGARPASGENNRPEEVAAGHEGDERRRAEARCREDSAARLGNVIALEVVDPHRGAGGHDAAEPRALETHPSLAPP